MQVFDVHTKALLYDGKTGDPTFLVTGDFWKRLAGQGVSVRSGGRDRDGTFYTTVGTMRLRDKDFEREIAEFAATVVGAAMMAGDLPPDYVA